MDGAVQAFVRSPPHGERRETITASLLIYGLPGIAITVAAITVVANVANKRLFTGGRTGLRRGQPDGACAVDHRGWTSTQHAHAMDQIRYDRAATAGAMSPSRLTQG